MDSAKFSTHDLHGRQPEPVPRNEHYVFLAGAASGLVEGITIQPLEMLKTRFQVVGPTCYGEGRHLQSGIIIDWPIASLVIEAWCIWDLIWDLIWIHTGANKGILASLRDIIKEGGVRQLYRGGLPEITGLIPRASAALSTLEFSQRKFKSLNNGKLSVAGAYLSGMASGVSESVAFGPFQVVKVRLIAKEHLGRYLNTWDCIKQIWRQEGAGAFAVGMVPSLYKNCVWNGIYYGTMYQVEDLLPTQSNGLLWGLQTITTGTSVALLATAANTPFDVVKSRFQSQLPSKKHYHHVFPSLVQIYREEGPQALYKGFLPKALRLGIGQTIGLMVFREMLLLLKVEG